MSQVSMHNESSMATIHWSANFAVSEAVKHLAAVLRLLSPSDQLKMMVRLESFLDMDDHVRYLAVVSSRPTGSVPLSSDAHQEGKSVEEVCILGIDVAMPVKSPVMPAAASSMVLEPSSQSVPASPVKAQRSHSTVSPDHHYHQTIGSRIASRARKFMTLPKQKSKVSTPSPACLAQRPSVSSSRLIRLDELSPIPDDTDAHVHLGLTLPIWADSKITLDGDGGFRVESKDRHHCFKPVSVQAMWSVLQTLLQASENARHHHQLSPAAWSHRNLHLSVSAFNLPSSAASSSNSSTSSHLLSHSTVDLTSSVAPVHHLSHEWVDKYSQRIDSQWCKEWHLILEDYLTLSEEQSEASGSKARRPLSPHLSRHRQQTYSPTETRIRQNLRDVMLKVDLEQVNSKEIRNQVEKNLKIDLSSYKSFIDHEILVILGQMDKASEIFDYLYLGTEWNASNLDELTTKDIGLVLNITTEINNSFPDKFEYRNIRVNDVEEEPMVKHWEDCFRYISEAKKERKRVLVHCKMGVSRSASVVIAYTMKANDWNLQQAMRFVQQKRGCVKPNPGFMKQLEEYEGILEASKHRTSFQSGLTGSTLSLCETRSSSSKYCSAELDELLGSNLRRASSEFFSVPNLSPSVPQRSVSLTRKSRLATFYLGKESDSSPEKPAREEEGRSQRRSKKEKKAVQWEPIAEVNLKDDTNQDESLGLIRVVVDSHTFHTPEEALAVTSPRSTFPQPSPTVHAAQEWPLTSSFCLMRQAASSLVTTMPKVKVRQSRLSASSVFGLSSSSSLSSSPKEPGRLSSTRQRPVSLHVSSYLKAKDPVQTLVKYFDELTHTPASHTSLPPTTHLTAAPQAAQV